MVMDFYRLKLISETDNMEEAIRQRKKEIGQIESIMQNINAIAKDINIEVQTQGEKLVRLEDHMRTAASNVVEAK
jgi:t-SNARE complex subunit (syntaxin)